MPTLGRLTDAETNESRQTSVAPLSGVVAPPWGEEATYYVRMQRYSDGPHYWPPGGMGREVARTGNEPGQ